MPNLYALLVAINTYPEGIRSLNGCVNDADAMEQLLRTRFSDASIYLKRLNNADATRQSVIDSFRSHLAQAGKDDIALFFYAGHGSQVPTGGLFADVEPDGMNESIVCYDSRVLGAFDLVDKDIATLIEEVTAKGVHLTTIFDSCHSGSIDRGFPVELSDGPAPGTRSIPPRSDAQPASAYLRDVAAPPPGMGSLTLASADNFVPDLSGLHVLLAACEDNETAQEYFGEGNLHGAFTWFLTQTLANAKTPLGYRELMHEVRDAMNGRVAGQTPKLESAGSDAIFDNLFLGLKPTPWTDYAFASFGLTGAWQLDRGAVMGVAVGDRWALYSLDAVDAYLNDPAKAIGFAAVSAAQPAVAILQPDAGAQLDQGLHYKAVPAAAEALDHIATWKKRLALENPATQIPAAAVDFVITTNPGTTLAQTLSSPPASRVELAYFDVPQGQDPRPAYTALVRNNFTADLYCALLVFSEDYSIYTGLLSAETQKLGPGETTYALSGRPIHCSVPATADETTDELLLVVSTDWFDATLFRMDPLDPAAAPTREAPADATPQHDFFTRRVTFHTTRNKPAQ